MFFLCKFMQVYAFSCILFDCLQRFIHVIQQIYLFYRFIAYTLALVRPCAKIFNLLTTNLNICCQFARFRHYSSDKSFMSGLNLAIKSNFFALLQPLSCFSLAMASSMLPQSST